MMYMCMLLIHCHRWCRCHEGEVNSGGYIESRSVELYIAYLALRTDSEGDSCFSIYQSNQLDKNQKGTFWK